VTSWIGVLGVLTGTFTGLRARRAASRGGHRPPCGRRVPKTDDQRRSTSMHLQRAGVAFISDHYRTAQLGFSSHLGILWRNIAALQKSRLIWVDLELSRRYVANV
jgi:hypothetical protein